jgi:hypothetical protein
MGERLRGRGATRNWRDHDPSAIDFVGALIDIVDVLW